MVMLLIVHNKGEFKLILLSESKSYQISLNGNQPRPRLIKIGLAYCI